MKKIVNYQNRQFICYVGCPFNGMVEVAVWEIKRPHWPIFKDSYCDSFSFILDEEDTIDQCVKRAILKLLAEEEEENKLHDKWKNFEKTLDKPMEL